MSVAMGIAIYMTIWWVVLFAVLPFGVRSQHEGGEMAPGTDPSAPVRPRILAKALITTAVSAVIFGLFLVLKPYM